MLFPDYIDLVKYHCDPDEYMAPGLSEEGVETVKNNIQSGLERLRSN